VHWFQTDTHKQAPFPFRLIIRLHSSLYTHSLSLTLTLTLRGVLRGAAAEAPTATLNVQATNRFITHAIPDLTDQQRQGLRAINKRERAKHVRIHSHPLACRLRQYEVLAR